MDEDEFREFESQVTQDAEAKQKQQEKFDKKLKKRQQKKELKQGMNDPCKTQ